MARLWRSPGALMTVFLVLFVIAGPWGDISEPGRQGMVSQGRNLPAILIAAFLAWRVAHGGRISRVLIIVFTIVGAGAMINSGSARAGDPAAFGFLAIYAVQVAILLSTPIYNRTRQDHADITSAGAPVWETPPRWVPLAAAAAGIIITLLFLGSMTYRPVSSCQAPGSLSPHAAPLAQCGTLAEGFPVPYLTAPPAVSLNSGSAVTPANLSVFANPVINKSAAAADLATWTLASFTACYMLWLPSRRAARSPATTKPVLS
jgi:hypothetical protein